MKTLLKSKTRKFRILILILALTAFNLSCSKEEVCESGNTGTVIVENNRNEGNVNVYFNTSQIGVNTPGDISVKPGEKGTIDIPAGTHNVLVRLRISSCNGNRCAVQTTTLDEKSIDLSTCETLNMTY